MNLLMRGFAVLVALSGLSALAGCSEGSSEVSQSCREYSDAMHQWGARAEANARSSDTLVTDLVGGLDVRSAVSAHLERLQVERATYEHVQELSQAMDEPGDRCLSLSTG